jgi:hypothetical protein
MCKVKLIFGLIVLTCFSNQTFAQYNVGNDDGFDFRVLLKTGFSILDISGAIFF